MADKRYSDARTICREQISDSATIRLLRHYESFVDELARSCRQQDVPGFENQDRLFNDTDFRVNIGCRLTSQGLKQQILEAFPGAKITSIGFNFSAFRKDSRSPHSAGGYAPSDIESRLSTAYGEDAVDHIAAAIL